ncbi:MAG: thiolase family protein, partial [Planctomycetes bacterium]|nr:thiolase family protein [Planctomycetota bacterium]
REALYRCGLVPADVDEVIAGNVAGPPEAANVARVISLRAGIPQDRIAHTVCRNCASGMECLTEAVQQIEFGNSHCVVAVGVDSMSNIPVFWQKRLADKFWRVSRARTVFAKLQALSRIRPADLKPEIGLVLGLTDPTTGLMMGETAEKLAREFQISREEQDAFAYQSQQRALTAWEGGRFQAEVMTVYPSQCFARNQRNGSPVERDDGPRSDSSLERLARLKPVFDRRWGSVTVGNSCQVTDGAAALVLMSPELAGEKNLSPIGRIRSFAYAGCDPSRMGLGPVVATAEALKRADLTLQEIDLVELNEAFAAQVLSCLKVFAGEYGSHQNADRLCLTDEQRQLLCPIEHDRLNVNGGAIALGHPVGATGTRLVLTLLNELTRRRLTTGLATLCVGGGQGAAVIVERTAEECE